MNKNPNKVLKRTTKITNQAKPSNAFGLTMIGLTTTFFSLFCAFGRGKSKRRSLFFSEVFVSYLRRRRCLTFSVLQQVTYSKHSSSSSQHLPSVGLRCLIKQLNFQNHPSPAPQASRTKKHKKNKKNWGKTLLSIFSTPFSTPKRYLKAIFEPKTLVPLKN